MKTYEKHEFSKKMLEPAPEDLVDPMAVYLQTLETAPDIPDEYSALKIEEVQRWNRVRDREELRPMEPDAPGPWIEPEPLPSRT